MSRPGSFLLLLVGLSGCGPSQREIAVINASARQFHLGPAGLGRKGLGAGAARGLTDLVLPVGTRIVTLLDRSITTESNTLGGAVTSSVAFEVKDAQGRIAIPGGARVDLVIIRPSRESAGGETPVDLKVAAVNVRGQRVGIAGRVVSASQPIESRAIAAAAPPGRRVLVSGGATIVIELTAPLTLPAE